MQGLITDSGIRHDILEKFAGRASSERGARSLFVCGGAGLAAGVSCAGTMNLQLQAKLRAVPDVPPGKVPENAQTLG